MTRGKLIGSFKVNFWGYAEFDMPFLSKSCKMVRWSVYFSILSAQGKTVQCILYKSLTTQRLRWPESLFICFGLDHVGTRQIGNSVQDFKPWMLQARASRHSSASVATGSSRRLAEIWCCPLDWRQLHPMLASSHSIDKGVWTWQCQDA